MTIIQQGIQIKTFYIKTSMFYFYRSHYFATKVAYF